MDIFETIAARYSVRGYKPDPVDDETLDKVLEAARLAPTAANRQPFRLIVVHTKGREEELARVYGRRWFTARAAGDRRRRRARRGLAAFRRQALRRGRRDDRHGPPDPRGGGLGLGTCWIAAFDPAAAREVLGLPDDVEPIAFTPLGWPAKASAGTGRKPLDELVKYERW